MRKNKLQCLHQALLRSLIAAFLLALAALNAQAQVNTCDALTLYGDAAASGLCSSLSPGTQNLWVCELGGGGTDIHTTFNATTNLHLTVRVNPSPPGCSGNVNLNGSWDAALRNLAPVAGAAICNVNPANYTARLNAVPYIAATAGVTACRAGFLQAQASGRINAAVTGSYLALCATHACP